MTSDGRLDVNKVNATGATALYIAALSLSRPLGAIVETLLRVASIDVYKADAATRTPCLSPRLGSAPTTCAP
jgi:hypothetical protein